MKHYLGIDIGSVNVKLALIDESGALLHRNYLRIESDPRRTVNALLSALKERQPGPVTATGVSGSGRGIVPRDFGWVEYSSSLAIASGLLAARPDARTIIGIGGHSSYVIELEDGLNKPWKVASNPLCAAGTGVFLEQQAYRLGISLDRFAELALGYKGSPPRIAARCSVFAKSDLIHLQQKGAPLDALCYALCESIARMVASLKKGPFAGPVYAVGGLASSPAIIKALASAISARNGSQLTVTVPEDHLYTECYGAAMLARGKESRFSTLPGTDAGQRYYQMPALGATATTPQQTPPRITQACRGYLGVDVGSTSTKAVILDESGKKILAKNYLMTAGRPVDAVKEVFRNLLHDGAETVQIAAAGVTGSGRYLIGSLIGADLVKNEITAQTRAAVEIDPEADIFELGGQDSKLVIKRNGVVVDYQMNKACAAGTGSFIDEMAESLGVSVKDGHFARLAFQALHTIDLGTRCAAFMGQAVAAARLEGMPLDVICASLARSIARNYLTKVVGHRRLGKKIILTGAVFYNEAVVAAFKEELKDKDLTVAEQREVSGAIGAALLAKEATASRTSRFKGFEAVAQGDVRLTTFTCKRCDDNCTITQMRTAGEKPTFYGSRCDRYDSLLAGSVTQTAFETREKLLLGQYHEGEGKGIGPTVGVPRSLMVYDYAPLILGFLNTLGAHVNLSGQTSRKVMERAVELSYTDSCFPIKLLHGHTDAVAGYDFILYPTAIRLGRKEGEQNQKYACPLVQASPYIVRHVLGLEGKLLSPILDFSLGDEEVIANLAGAAVKMGFGRAKGIEAARAGLEAQRGFETARVKAGAELLSRVSTSHPGVVLLARSYVAQDSGANLGIAAKLAQLGVVPVPLDFLPLDSVDPGQYSDRPYWSYEGKLIAAAAIIASDPRLYGLVLTNFGCGPNSFILKMLEDIMGPKPMGQLEIDEHAAEAGLITRLEAFVDTIAQYGRGSALTGIPAPVFRGASPTGDGRTILIPRMAPHAEALGAAMQSFGVNAIVLPEPDDRNLLEATKVTSGTECLPFRVTLGDFIRYCRENGNDAAHVEGFMTGSFGPCRLGKYAIEHMRILRELGFDLPLLITVSNNAYGDLNLGTAFERHLWRGIVAVDYLQKLLWHCRPYEKEKGTADRLFRLYLTRISDCQREHADLPSVLRSATSDFGAAADRSLPARPLVGINGEVFLRLNEFSNRDLARVCEDAGLEVMVSPVSEWIRYTAYRNLEDAVKNRDLSGTIRSFIRKNVIEHDEHTVARCFNGRLDGKEPTTSQLLARSSGYISPRCGSEAVLSTGSGIEWLESPRFAGVISVMPHGCMPGGIVAAMADRFSTRYHKPWVSLTYDGFQESANQARINEFAELVRFCQKNGS